MFCPFTWEKHTTRNPKTSMTNTTDHNAGKQIANQWQSDTPTARAETETLIDYQHQVQAGVRHTTENHR